MPTVYVLGAGASHFAGFPLGRELLGFLKTEWTNTGESMVRKLGRHALDFIEAVKPTLPPTRVLHGEPDLEFVLSLTDEGSPPGSDDSLIGDLHSVTNAVDFRTWNVADVRMGFTMLVQSAFLYESYRFRQRLTMGPCRTDDDLVATSAAWVEKIHPGDTVITFNWDLLQEIILSQAGKWFHADGYGIRNTSAKLAPASPTTILKLHGSCNWALRHREDEEVWIQDAYLCGALDYETPLAASLGSTADYGESLIIPSYLKDPSRVRILQSTWRRAEDALAGAETLVVLGYSLPEADAFARRLFEASIQRNRTLKSITLVLGADDESFNRWSRVLGDLVPKRDVRTFEQWVSKE